MFYHLFSKEVRELLMTFRFGAALITTFVLIALSVIVLGDDYLRRRSEYNRLADLYAQEAAEVYVPSMISPQLHRPPSPLSIFAEGETKHLGNTVGIRRWQVPVHAAGSLTDNMLLKAYPSFDLMTVFILVVSVFGVLFSYDSLSGERERGILKQIFSNPVSRGTVYVAKFAAASAVLAIPVAISFLASLLIISFYHGIGFTGPMWTALALMLFSGLVYGAARAKPGLVKRADGGTLFLDEIGEISNEIQVKLLRFLQGGEFIPLGDSAARKVDVRIIAASNRELPKAVAEGRFREDLFYRLNVVPISIPPLRDRPEDIVPLVNHFVSKHGSVIGKEEYSFASEVIDAFLLHDWPGNVRELENAVHSALVMVRQSPISLGDLPVSFMGYTTEDAGVEKSGSLKEIIASFTEKIERKEILAALRESGGNQSQAARRLGINRRTLIRKIGRYYIPRTEKTR